MASTRPPQLRSWLASASAVVAVICNLGIARPAAAQLRALENPSFESNNPGGPGSPSWEIVSDSIVIGWRSTTGEIELWDHNFNGVPAFSGNVLAEMNANAPGALFQNICLVNGEPLGWTFSHRAREGGQATQTARFEVANSSGTVLQLLATQTSQTSNLVWNVNSGTTTYTGPSGLQRVQFSTSDPGSVGNLLDMVQLTLRPFIQLSTAAASGAENVASPGQPSLLVSGTTQSAITVTVTVTGGTAARGTDYTTPGGGATFTVTVPAGTYFNSAIPLGITIIDDNAVESSETITYSLSAGSGYTVGHTTTCGSPVQTSSTYTITDNDARLTMRKQWIDAAVGDVANLAVTRGGSTIDTFTAVADALNETDTDPTPTPVSFGQTVILSEVLPTSNFTQYTAGLACTGAADTNLADGLTVAAGETAIVCTYSNTGRPRLRLTKTSTVVSDGVNTTNPKAIPGAVIDYCIVTTNPTSQTASNVTISDPLPSNLSYIANSARSGTTCATATTTEDDNATGTDETDPHGASFGGNTLLAGATTLAAGASFAIVFSARVN